MENPVNSDEKQQKKKARKERIDLVFAILSLLIAATMPAAALLGSQGSFGKLSDFPEYYSVARMIREGHGSQIYVLDKLFEAQHQDFPQLETRGIGYYIPPFATPMIAPLGLLPPMQSYIVFILSSCASLLASVIILGKHFKLKASSCVWLATLMSASAPAFESLKIAQLAPFLLLALSMALSFLKRHNDIAAGASLAIILLKPQELFPMLVYGLFSRRFKLIASTVICGSVLLLLSFAMIGMEGYQNYFLLLKDSAANTQFMQPELGATVRGQLLRIPFLEQSSINLMSTIILIITLAKIAFESWRKRNTNFEEGLLQLALPLGLVTALHCHDYDLLLLLPYLLSMFCNSDKSKAAEMARGFLIILSLFLSTPVFVLIHYDMLMRQKIVPNPIFIFLALSAVLSAMSYSSRKKAPEEIKS